jgi:hypothetical protein
MGIYLLKGCIEMTAGGRQGPNLKCHRLLSWRRADRRVSDWSWCNRESKLWVCDLYKLDFHSFVLSSSFPEGILSWQKALHVLGHGRKCCISEEGANGVLNRDKLSGRCVIMTVLMQAEQLDTPKCNNRWTHGNLQGFV